MIFCGYPSRLEWLKAQYVNSAAEWVRSDDDARGPLFERLQAIAFMIASELETLTDDTWTLRRIFSARILPRQPKIESTKTRTPAPSCELPLEVYTRRPKPVGPWREASSVVPVDVDLPLPVHEVENPVEAPAHFIEDELERRARSLVSHGYAVMDRRRSRRYEGFRGRA
jgi:hypothetical protein